MEALILPVRGLRPQIPESTFLAPNCTVVGDVTMGEGCSIWFNAVVRGDVNFIRIGNEVNIQDGAVIHGTYQKHGTTIGNQVVSATAPPCTAAPCTTGSWSEWVRSSWTAA